MSTPILHLRQITDQLTAMHRTGDGIAGRLLLRGEGLVPGRPEALPPVAEFFAIGAVGPMAETAMRLNREPGRNVRVSPKVCSVDLGADVLGTLGFGLALRDANAETWVQRVPYGPTTAFGEPNDAANGKNVYTIWLFDHPEPEAAVAPVADYIAGVAGGVVAEDWPVVGSLNYPAVGEPELVQLLLPWQQTCSLDQLRELIEAEKRARRFRMDAEDPDDSGKSEDRKPGKASTATAAAGDDMTVALAELSRVLYRRYRSIEVGSDVEVSQKISRELTARFGKIVWDEGAFWLYEERAGCWKMMGPEAVRRLLHSFDGAIYPTATGKPETMRLSKGRIDSVVHELAAILAEPHFFETAAAGINITSGFIHFDRLGTPGCCRTRPIIAAVMSSLATGARSSTMSPKTRPPTQSSINCSTAVFVTIPMPSRKRCWSPRSAAPRLPGWPPGCHSPRLRSFSGGGRIMESALLDLMRAMLPADAHVAIAASRFSDDRHIVRLPGKLLNAPDELSSAAVITSDIFKRVITGEPCVGRDVYRSAVEFRPIAMHVFPTNTLPLFTGGFDRGVQRRLGVLQFNHVIPENERIEKFGELVAREEPDLTIAFFVAGASRLIRRRRFTEPPSSRLGLITWLYSSDPVLAWTRAKLMDKNSEEGQALIASAFDAKRDPKIDPKSSYAYEDFRDWAKAAGFRENLLPAVNGFSGRVEANCDFVKLRHFNIGNRFEGAIIAEVPEQEIGEGETVAR